MKVLTELGIKKAGVIPKEMKEMDKVFKMDIKRVVYNQIITNKEQSNPNNHSNLLIDHHKNNIINRIQ